MVTLIGDAHGKFDQYYNIVKNKEYSIQLGDFGFTKEWAKLGYYRLPSDSHKIIGGNHDCYTTAPHSPHYLGDFGEVVLGGITAFFIRGGLSIDRVYRIGEELSGGPKTWWSQEELSFSQMIECLALYEQVKPDIVLSHVPAAQFTHTILGNNSDAVLQRFKFHRGFRESHQLLGDELIKIHKPKIWASGHLHSSFQGVVNGVYLLALNELETFDLTMDVVHQLSAQV